MKKIIIAIVVLVIIGVGVFFYMTRPVAVSQNSSDVASGISPEGSFVLYRINPSQSKATFVIDEILNGSDKTVIGETSNIGGEVSLSLENLADGQIGEILVNARTFKTDSERRDGAIARFILKSEEHEFIRFNPESVRALNPGTPTQDEPVRYEVTGDLTIAGVTKKVTFSVLLTSINENTLTARGETQITRTDFNITIPSVQSVTYVADSVTLQIDIVAERVSN